jgi:hypothetical protein
MRRSQTDGRLLGEVVTEAVERLFQAQQARQTALDLRRRRLEEEEARLQAELHAREDGGGGATADPGQEITELRARLTALRERAATLVRENREALLVVWRKMQEDVHIAAAAWRQTQVEEHARLARVAFEAELFALMGQESTKLSAAEFEGALPRLLAGAEKAREEVRALARTTVLQLYENRLSEEAAHGIARAREGIADSRRALDRHAAADIPLVRAILESQSATNLERLAAEVLEPLRSDAEVERKRRVAAPDPVRVVEESLHAIRRG